MLIDLVNRFGRPAGNVDVPDDLLDAARRVERWMMENGVREFCGLTANPRADIPRPHGLHWLGDRPAASASQHETDKTGCVMYFNSEEDCLKFMRWLGALDTKLEPGIDKYLPRLRAVDKGAGT